MSFIPKKFHEILLSRFSGVALTNCLSSIFNFGQILSSKRGITPRKKWNQIPSGYAHLYIKSFITSKFQTLLNGFRWVALTNCFSSIVYFGQISKLKKGVILRKKNESKFPVDMHIWYYLHNYNCNVWSKDLDS